MSEFNDKLLSTYPTRVQTRALLILSRTRPTQQISWAKLQALVPEYRTDALREAVRALKEVGLVTQQMRRKHQDGALLTFHAGAVPEAQRTVIKRDHNSVGEPVVYTTARTFQVAAGLYTAKQLEPLAREVIRELGLRIEKK